MKFYEVNATMFHLYYEHIKPNNEGVVEMIVEDFMNQEISPGKKVSEDLEVFYKNMFKSSNATNKFSVN